MWDERKRKPVKERKILTSCHPLFPLLLLFPPRVLPPFPSLSLSPFLFLLSPPGCCGSPVAGSVGYSVSTANQKKDIKNIASSQKTSISHLKALMNITSWICPFKLNFIYDAQKALKNQDVLYKHSEENTQRKWCSYHPGLTSMYLGFPSQKNSILSYEAP